MKKTLIITSAVVGAIVIVCGLFIFIGYQKFMSIDAVEYDPELEILFGGGGNSIILTAEDGLTAFVVDTKMGSAAKAMRKKVKVKGILVINTHAHQDHIGGNGLYPDAKLIAGAYTKEQWESGAGKSRYPDETIKPGEEKILRIGSEIVHIRNMGNAHTSNDVVVYLEKRKLLVTGDIVFLNKHPVLFAKSGCKVASWVNVLDSLYNRYDIKALVPGHGDVSDKNALISMRDYFTDIRDAVGDASKLAVLKKKYKAYSSVPGMSSFEKTIAFIKNEQGNK